MGSNDSNGKRYPRTVGSSEEQGLVKNVALGLDLKQMQGNVDSPPDRQRGLGSYRVS